MKYIRCARNTSEQNTVVFQFGADIYFQTYKTINPGEEILAWYAEYYEQYFGIPVGVKKLNKTKETSQTGRHSINIVYFQLVIQLSKQVSLIHLHPHYTDQWVIPYLILSIIWEVWSNIFQILHWFPICLVSLIYPLVQHILLPQWFNFNECNRHTRLHLRPTCQHSSPSVFIRGVI